MCTGFKNPLCYVAVFEKWQIKYMYCICSVHMSNWYNDGLWYNHKTEEKLPTIEGEIFRALKKTGLVPEDIMEEPKKINYNPIKKFFQKKVEKVV